ncbi:MAG: SWIM zinc finger domain-containing protein [Spirochaetaceae bacterium]|jgi:hypothetical protein|nr:SWIM zinc finger domain-containing protein [Spirochaetaceae bacterium]
MPMNITEDFIIHFTGNAATVSNGRSLAAKGCFTDLSISGDNSLLFGSCAGSGSKPYACSVDFSDPQKPVPRCSCPSRQVPCKHVAGLLFCKVQGKAFTTREMPEDLRVKREKAKAREEKKAEKKTETAGEDSGESDARTEKAKAAAKARAASQAVKKCRAQLEGIDMAEKILRNIVRAGLHSIDRKNQKLYLDQAKELGNYYIDGIQAALIDLLLTGYEAQAQQDFTPAVGAVNYLYALLKKSRAHTEQKIADHEAAKADGAAPAASRDTALNSSLEEQTGYAWKLTELRELGRVVENARLLQAGFSVVTDNAKKQFVDEGIWLCLTDRRVYLTRNYRPFKALKHVREEDSFFPLLMTEELFVYPGDRNPRVRWERSEQREPGAEDLRDAVRVGETDFAEALKSVRNQIKSPLSDKNPVFALRIARLALEGTEGMAVFDEKGVKIPLRLDNFAPLLKSVSREQAEGNTLVCRFDQDMKTDILWAVPVALVTGDGIIRFLY